MEFRRGELTEPCFETGKRIGKRKRQSKECETWQNGIFVTSLNEMSLLSSLSKECMLGKSQSDLIRGELP